ncbi:hypothetical protein SCHPADRAFT_947336 [Schizopora paradoxa]|uniref:Uncharacterized protein n=1 Tax=Schizopora paradoxa TaxID=27342 RepID=A0A0H2QZV5_9AGAM|nr:hypothetical protein SCHPADRAFT_947336 [Schizopora paradoxa]
MPILPPLYYLCSRFPLETSIDHIQSLPKDYAKQLFLGRDWLCEISQHLFKQSLQSARVGGSFAPICKYPHCLEKFRAQLAEKYPKAQPERRFMFVFDLPEHGILEDLDMQRCGICEPCETKYLEMLNEIKRFAWNRLPVKFLNMTWEDLRRK